MSATTIASYGRNGQKDVCLFARATGGTGEKCEIGGTGEVKRGKCWRLEVRG
jgi:hypothetical protein